MLCSPNEGAAAVVLKAGDTRDGRGTNAGCALPRPRRCGRTSPAVVLGEATPMSGMRRHPHPAAVDARRAAPRTRQAGVGPGDLDVVECQDTDAARELLAYQELGLCEPGDQPRMVADGDVAIGGRLPVNPSGGLLSKGEPLGASALGQVVEIVRQLRGEAGARQVAGARSASPTRSGAAPTPAA